MARSGRNVGSTRTASDGSAAIFRCSSSESVGSSVVQTSTTFICRRMPRQENSGWARRALHSFQMPRAVSGPSKRSEMPSGRFNSMCVQWYSGLRSVLGTVWAQARNFSSSEASPVM